MKINKPILIVLGEPNSVFIEILSKVLNKDNFKKKSKNPIILIGSKKLINSQLKKLKKNIKFRIIEFVNNKLPKLKNDIYLLDVKYKFTKPFESISAKSKNYISKSFEIGLKIINLKLSNLLINGPISKKYFLNYKYPGITEYIFKKSDIENSKKPVMLIFNKEFSVSPITTHISLKEVPKNINKEIIASNIEEINEFYKTKLNIKPRIAVLGLNPHCESKFKNNEERLKIIPAIKKLKKRNIKVDGPFSADTFFQKKNIKKYDTVVGMYHDQVLTPFKTIFGFNASNVTLGLPFLRMSVDHGPNVTMLGKNKSNTESLENIFNIINLLK